MEVGFPKTIQDEATRKTAGDAWFSKISSAELGYFTDGYSKFFTKNKRKMMPLINRGTWTRVFSVRTLVNNFLSKFPTDKIQIVSLGAGFDWNFFYYQENVLEFNERDLHYFEVDFEDITAQKIDIIKQHSEIEELIFKDAEPSYEEGMIQTERYTLLSWDIRQVDDLEDKLVQAGLDKTIPTLVLTECVLCYMNSEDSSQIIAKIAEMFADVAIVNFEMINPNDPFGTTMVENLEARGCQLLGLKDVPDESAQVARMVDNGFQNGYCENMLRIHNSKLDETERSRIERIEMFDEFEEWDLLQSHYCICVGSKFSDSSELGF